MNERIRQLVGQAKFMAEESINKQISANTELNAFAEKFAELIVQECAKIANAGIDPAESHLIGDDILQHFGVEEQTNLNNIIAGAEVMSGDGGYKIGTIEAYQEFVKKRNAL
jgi:hypothetical protein